MALTLSPFGTYPAVTGVVNPTAAAEIVALLTELKTFFPDKFTGLGAGYGTPAVASDQPARTPGFDKMPLDMAEKLVAEITALQTAIAAAPAV